MQLLLIGFIAWLSAQLVKFSISAFHETPDWRLFYQSGGMPSAHSATVIAVTVAALALEGAASPIFGLAAVLAAIVIYDSLGVRRASGEHSIALNILIKAAGNIKPIRELLGHTPREVLAGSILGVVVGGLATFSAWAPHAGFLAERPGDIEMMAYLGVFVAILAIALIKRIVLSRFRQVDIIKKLKTSLWWTLALPAVTGLFTSLLQFQVRGPGSWRLWAVLLLGAVVLSQLWLLGRLYRFVPVSYRAQKEQLLKRRKEERKTRRRKKKRKR